MLLSRFSSFGTGQFTKPIYLVSLSTLGISLAFVSLLLAGCTSPTAGIRKFYLLELGYTGDTAASMVKDLHELITKDAGGNRTFTAVRVGYRGICTLTTPDGDGDGDWACAPNAPADIAGDPFELARVADLFKDKISFSTPLWAALVCLAVAFLAVAVNCVPAIPIPPVTRRVAAAASNLGMLVLLGCMVLQQVTSGAIRTLVRQMGVGAVTIDAGAANAAFGWAAFGLAVVAAVGTAAVAAVEAATDRATRKGEELANRALEKASGGRVDLEDVRNFSKPAAATATAAPGPSFQFPPPPANSGAAGASARAKAGKAGVSIAQSLLRKGMAAAKK